mgnify:CR=1 FL=1|tara:strand:+ start:526 stop:801 length:276 start_codon:yes stop_codon:yes gene_type:complete
MKSYRIQIRHKGWYYDELTSGEDEETAIANFFKKGRKGKIQPKNLDPIYTPDRLFCTIEEATNGFGAIDNKKARVGVEVGITGVTAEASNS